ncbi:MAG: SUMF1/EgtB/PvdO family nonheme iron enzyme [Magnetococcales bacterium]|nr:SUMF1/EgtB/PvdO family nonheme iron enzyme [Magnetococcales bacterium]
MTEEYRSALPVGHRLHEYRIERILGAGGFGMTYLAVDENLGQRVAIKEYFPNDLAVREGVSVHPKSSSDKDLFLWGLEHFLQEAQALARFHHASIVRILRFFNYNNTAYEVMEYEDGDSLKNILSHRKTLLDEEALKSILFPLLSGLVEVHGAGLIHRDIAPDNIYIRYKDETPVLLDFGAARQAVGGKSRSLSVVVKDGYAPPEQYETHGNQGPWTDIYALGAVIYRAISGEVPPQSTARISALARGKADPLRPAQDVGRGRYSASFLRAVDHALERIETDRPQSAMAWREEFTEQGLFQGRGQEAKDVLQQEKTSSEPQVIQEEEKKVSVKQNKSYFLIFFIVIILALGGFYVAQVEKEQLKERLKVREDLAADGAKALEAARKEAAEAARKAEALEAARKAEALEAARKAEALEVARKAEAAEVARKAEALESARKAEAAEAARKAVLAEEKAQQAIASRAINIEFTRIPSGDFRMGSSDGDPDEQPEHKVSLPSFELGKYEVTVGQFKKFVQESGYITEAEKGGGCKVLSEGRWVMLPDKNWQNPGITQNDNHPVVCVSWNDAMKFLEWLNNHRDGCVYRLPTEAEWEYAARGGTETRRYWGSEETSSCQYANVADRTTKNKYPAWKTFECDDGYAETAPVGRYRANAFGVFDMLGNVSELVADYYVSSYYQGSPQHNPQGPNEGEGRVRRGGSWATESVYLRVANRDNTSPSTRTYGTGFRVARKCP